MSAAITKFGARWVVDGPYGRFHTKTKKEAVQALRETGMEECWRCHTWVAYGTLNSDLLCAECDEKSVR